MEQTSKMDYQQFEQYVSRCFEERYTDSMSVDVRTIVKNNGVSRRSLFIMPQGGRICPAIYLEEFYGCYLQGISIENIISKIEEICLKTSHSAGMEIEYYGQYESAKDTLFVRLINYEKNKAFLGRVPHVCLLDFALICYSRLQTADGIDAAINVTHSHLKQWNVDEEQLFAQAMQNSIARAPQMLFEMEELLNQMQKPDEQPLCSDGHMPMYVLTNIWKVDGAAVLYYPGVLAECAQKIQSDFYLIPSSIHEVILVPDKLGEKGELLNMVQEVNEEQVEEEEVLSDHIYRYTYQNRCLEDVVTDEVIYI